MVGDGLVGARSLLRYIVLAVDRLALSPSEARRWDLAENEGDMVCYVAAVGSRLGDMLVILPVVTALIREARRTYVIARSPVQLEVAELIEGLAGCVKEPELPQALEIEPGLVLDFFKDVNGRNHGLLGAMPIAEYERLSIVERLNIACTEFGIAVREHTLVPLSCQRIPDLSNTVAVVPGATSSSKRWPVAHWLELVARLRSCGLSCLMLGEPELCPDVRMLERCGVPLRGTPRLSEAVDVLSSVRLVVTVDTGFMHLAVNQGTPTIGMFNQLSCIWHRSYHHSYALVGDPCMVACLDKAQEVDEVFQQQQCALPCASFDEVRWGGQDYVPCMTPEAAPCMLAITPDTVLALAVDRGLLPSRCLFNA